MWRGRHRSMFSKTSLYTSHTQCYQGRAHSPHLNLDLTLVQCWTSCCTGVKTTSPLHSGPAAALVWTLGPRMFCSWAGAPLLLHRLAEDRSWAPGAELSCCSGDVESRLHTADHNTEPLMLTKVFLTMECCVFYE